LALVPDAFIVQGDLDPPLQVQLLAQDGSAPDLTGKTVTCIVRPANGCRGPSKTTLASTDYLDRRGGFVQHAWVAPETQDPGLLLVSFNDGTVTYPADSWYLVRVTPRLG
jgi:hypothetical protein